MDLGSVIASGNHEDINYASDGSWAVSYSRMDVETIVRYRIYHCHLWYDRLGRYLRPAGGTIGHDVR